MIKKVSIDLEEMISSYPTKYEEGFTNKEIDLLLSWFPTVNKEKFNNAMMGNTCAIRDKLIVNYHWDVMKALICGFENRELKLFEWD